MRRQAHKLQPGIDTLSLLNLHHDEIKPPVVGAPKSDSILRISAQHLYFVRRPAAGLTRDRFMPSLPQAAY